MQFHKNAIENLISYKRTNLGIASSGSFRGRQYQHILPEDMRMKNLLPACNNFITEMTLGRITLHRCFHHLNSSQAMCLNFFAPIIDSPLLNVILPDELACSGYEIMPETAVLEMPSPLDRTRGEIPTTFDFFVQAKNQTAKIVNLYVEIKYTENGFGTAKDDDRHKAKIEQFYLPLARSSRTIAPHWLYTESFRKNYQIIRNLVHIDEDSYVIFIFPAKNNSVEKDALRAKSSIVNDHYKNHLILKNWEEIIADIAKLPAFKSYQSHYEEFVTKYLPCY